MINSTNFKTSESSVQLLLVLVSAESFLMSKTVVCLCDCLPSVSFSQRMCVYSQTQSALWEWGDVTKASKAGSELMDCCQHTHVKDQPKPTCLRKGEKKSLNFTLRLQWQRLFTILNYLKCFSVYRFQPLTGKLVQFFSCCTLDYYIYVVCFAISLQNCRKLFPKEGGSGTIQGTSYTGACVVWGTIEEM